MRKSAGSQPEPSTKVRQVTDMFARIASSYDLMNRLMSLGKDQSWRRLAGALAEPPENGLALDVAAGTGDLALAVAERGCRVIAADPCAPMIALGREKMRSQPNGDAITFLLADALALPFPEATFDCVTVAFGVRNFSDLLAGFQEMRRVVKPGGRVVCLEIMPPDNGLLGKGYQLYLTQFIPRLGGVMSGHPEAYQYLCSSVLAFNTPQELEAIMREAGFVDVSYRCLNFNTIALHVGVR